MHTGYCPSRDIISLPYFETVYWEVRGAVYEIILRIRAYTLIRGDDYSSVYGIFPTFSSKRKSACSYLRLK